MVALVTLIAFGLSYLSPTDAAVHSFSAMGITPTADQLAAKRAELGLDQPFLVQFGTWLLQVFQGDLGTSFHTGAPVSDMLFEALPYTLALSFTTMAVVVAVSVPLGLVCAYRRGGVLDRVMQVVTYVFNAIPSFFVALLILYVFSVQFHWFAVLATRDFAGILMPTLSLALPMSAWFMRQVRASAVEELGKPYVDGLRSRGVSEKRILWVHVLRNLGVPILTLLGISFGMLLGGSAIVETIFNWPGLGLASIEAVGVRDYPFIGAYALAMAVLYLIMNALIDAAYHLIDRRITPAGGAHA